METIKKDDLAALRDFTEITQRFRDDKKIRKYVIRLIHLLGVLGSIKKSRPLPTANSQAGV